MVVVVVVQGNFIFQVCVQFLVVVFFGSCIGGVSSGYLFFDFSYFCSCARVFCIFLLGLGPRLS